MRVNNSNILDGYAQSSGSVSSSDFRIEHFSGYSVAITVSGQSSYGATAKLYASNDVGPNAQGAGTISNWVELPNTGATANIALAANGSSLWNVDGAFYKWIKVIVTHSAGSATLNIRVQGKGVDSQ